jgi:hypothetical protein
VFAPAALAFALLGPAAGQASAMPLCFTLNFNYERYDASTTYWSEHYAASGNSEDLVLARYFDTLRIATAQAIMQNNC